MVGMVERVAGADQVVVVDLVAQAGDHAEAMGAGLARRDDRDLVEQIAVAVEVAAGEGAAAEIAGDAVDRSRCCGVVGRPLASRAAGRVDVAKTFLRGHRAAAIGLHILEAGIDRQRQLVGQGEARIDADVAGVRRIVAAVEFGAAARLIGRRRCDAVGNARLRRIGEAGIVDVIFAFVAVASGSGCRCSGRRRAARRWSCVCVVSVRSGEEPKKLLRLRL